MYLVLSNWTPEEEKNVRSRLEKSKETNLTSFHGTLQEIRIPNRCGTLTES